MPLPYLILASALAYLLVCAVSRWHKISQALARINHRPGERTVFSISSPMGNFLPYIPYVSLGRNYMWRAKYQVFNNLGAEIYGTVSAYPPTSYLMLADAVAIKHVSYSRNNFGKNMEDYAVLNQFGSNLVVAEGEEWKRQRRIIAPAFSDKNNRLVWDTAKGFVEQMIGSWGPKKPATIHDVSEELALPLSLCVIAKAGFGRNVPLGTDVLPIGHSLTFKDALTTVSKTMHLPLILPNWAWGLRSEWSYAKRAHNELRLYLHEMIAVRRESKQQPIQELSYHQHDLFNQLIHARDADDVLTEDELIGNVFMFLLAGHETTSHTFAIALGLLALYPEVQDKLVTQLQELEREHGELTYGQMHLLSYAMAVVYETLRLFPMVGIIPKKATADATVTVGFAPNAQQVQVPASMNVHVCPTGLHYNPNYWENPDEFDPERFMDPHWNRDAFIPFSLGPRACIGRRFTETTLVAEMTTLISRYKVSIDETRFGYIEGEPILERRTRLINPETRITLTPAPIPLVFSPRV